MFAVLAQRPHALRVKYAGDGEQPSTPKKARKRKAGDGDAAPLSAEDALLEAAKLLRQSRLVSEHGIGALWGEPVQDIIAADAAIRAWRPIQARAAARPGTSTLHVDDVWKEPFHHSLSK